MKFEEKLKKKQYAALWAEYCGFLDLDMEGYMRIQNRLMEEQISLWSRCALGEKILGGNKPATIEEFRRTVPLTTYEDYADILLLKQGDMLPDTPIIWIQTTWEGGRHPIKVAPYTQAMLETYRNNILACLLLSTSHKRGQFNVKATDKILYALAPLPYATGLFPLALRDEIGMGFLPPVEEAVKMSFSERNKKGFKMGLEQDIEFFFGVGSVAYYVSTTLSSMSKGGSSGSSLKALSRCSPHMIYRLLRAKSRCKQEGRDLLPKDLFKLKGFMCAGTDSRCYKDQLEELWGVRPMELFAGTEPSCIGTETWTRNGMYFFPDACFYEFIPEAEMEKSIDDPSYQPRTYLMDEVIPGEKYELVISVLKGGAFMRYRVGDVYRCTGREHGEDGPRIPRFGYIDPVPTIMDIATFTRISAPTLESAIGLSGLPVADWTARKEYSPENRPFLHLYAEIASGALVNQAVTKEILREQLEIYFRHMDNDYKDLKRLLGIEPLQITIVKCGTFDRLRSHTGRTLRRLNPSAYDVKELLEYQ